MDFVNEFLTKDEFLHFAAKDHSLKILDDDVYVVMDMDAYHIEVWILF